MEHRRRRRARLAPRANIDDLCLRVIAHSVPPEDAVPAGVPIVAGLEPRDEWTVTGSGTVDDFVAEAIARGAPPPTTAIFRGAEVVALGGLIVVAWRGGVIAGPPEAVARAMDREEAEHGSDA